jgi:hypothetical protein
MTIIKHLLFLVLNDITVRLLKIYITTDISLLLHIDPDLSRDNLIQMNNETTYFPLNVLLRNTK